MKMTDRSARWMQTVLANCESNTGRTLPEWIRLAKKARVEDAKGARAWAKTHGLSIVYAAALVDDLFPAEEADDTMIDAQYSGPKAPLRPIYEAVIGAARKLGSDVAVMPRKSQVTLSRATTFAIVRAGAKDRVDVALKLHGEKPNGRLVADPKAARSDPSHVVALKSRKDVDRAFVGWLRLAYERASG